MSRPPLVYTRDVPDTGGHELVVAGAGVDMRIPLTPAMALRLVAELATWLRRQQCGEGRHD